MSKTKHEEILSEEMFNELKPIYADANCKNCPSEWFFTTLNKFAVNVKFKKNVTTLLTNTIV